MEIGRDQNEESPYEVKEGPGDREADEQAEGRLEPFCGHVRARDRGGPPAKTVRAQKLSLMLCHAFPAEILRAGRTAGNRCPVRMSQASLKSEVSHWCGEAVGRLVARTGSVVRWSPSRCENRELFPRV